MTDGGRELIFTPGDVYLFFEGHPYGSHNPETAYRAMNISFARHPMDQYTESDEPADDSIAVPLQNRLSGLILIRSLFQEIVYSTLSGTTDGVRHAETLLRQLLLGCINQPVLKAPHKTQSTVFSAICRNTLTDP